MKNVKLLKSSGLTFVFTAIVVIFLVDSNNLSRVAGWIPRVTLASTLLLLIVQMLIETGFRFRRPGQARASESQTVNDFLGGGSEKAMMLAIAWISSLAPIVWLFGMSAGATVFCFAYLRWHAGETWKFSLVFSAALGIVMQLGFTGILHIALYPGVLT